MNQHFTNNLNIHKNLHHPALRLCPVETLFFTAPSLKAIDGRENFSSKITMVNPIMKITIVDKSQLVIDILGDFLLDLGYEIIGVDDPFLFVQGLPENNQDMDIIIIDPGAPKGKDEKIILKIMELRPNSYIIVMSEGTLPRLPVNASGKPGWDYLKKPVKLAELEQLVISIGDRKGIKGQG